MSWYLAPSLVKLREQLNALFPSRSKLSDGSIGDERHQKESTSDHNPHVKDFQGVGVVTAIDITNDAGNGPEGHKLSRQLVTDPRVKYVIFNRQIFKTRQPELGWQKYTGTNAHDHHVHVSIKPDARDSVMPWPLGNKTPVPESQIRPTLKLGSTGQEVRLIQEKLHLEVDGQFGYATKSAVEKVQRAHGLKADGIVGAFTWAAILE